jgi:hypothetical protein
VDAARVWFARHDDDSLSFFLGEGGRDGDHYRPRDGALWRHG